MAYLWQAETTYAFSDGRELADSEAWPDESISAKDWRRDYGQQWNGTKSLKEKLIQREEDAYFNSQLWLTLCLGLNLETLHAIAQGGDIEALILEIGGLPWACGATAGYGGMVVRTAGMAEAFRAGPRRGGRVRHAGSLGTQAGISDLRIMRMDNQG